MRDKLALNLGLFLIWISGMALGIAIGKMVFCR